ncbi:MAG: hypothetical protein V3T77_04280 [Planctomycetota bacterium]
MRFHRIGVLVLLLAGCINPLSRSGASWATNSQVQMPAAGVKSLKIRCGNGSVKVEGAPGERNVTVLARIRSNAKTLPEAERIAREVTLELQSQGTENPSLVINEPRTEGAHQDYWVDLLIQLPASVRVEIEEMTGDCNVSGLNGGFSLHNFNGRIDISQVFGGVEVKSDGSSCIIKSVGGVISVTDKDGDLSISEVSGEVKVTDSGGKLKIYNITGNVIVSDNAPDIRNVDGDVMLYRVQHALAKIQGVTGQISYPIGSP